jgi:hypothetical protein
MFVIFKISVMLNVVTIELVTSETIFTVLISWDARPSSLVGEAEYIGR